MRHWLQLATRNWRVKRVRTAGAVLAIALGTGAVVWVTCCYESVRQTVLDWAASYVGSAHVTIQSPLGRYDVLPERLVGKVEAAEGVVHAAPLLVQRLPAAITQHQSPTTAGEAPAATADRAASGDLYNWVDELDVHGIDVGREFEVRDWRRMLVAGRMLTEKDNLACVLEASIAHEQGVGVGDTVLVWGGGPESEPVSLEIVGLIHRRRVERFLKAVALVRLPVLQQITSKFALVNSVDIILRDPSDAGLRAAVTRIRAMLRGDVPNAQVRSAASRLAQVRRAQEQQEIVLVLLSCVAMLTALFIILSTLSMGMIERITQMGLLRCLGTTRLQLAWLTLAEVFPLGVVGIVLGVPVGLGLTALTVWLVPEYVGDFAVSGRGVFLAAAAGLATVLVAAALPALATATVSPLEATRPRARAPRFVFVLLAFVLAAVALGTQFYIMAWHVRRDIQFVDWSAAAVVLLYLAYALAAPLVVWLISRLAVPAVAALVGVRLRLLQEQVGRAVWRSAGICCGLMVGLSLIVGLVVFNMSFKSGWQFPKQFPEAYIWSFDQINGDVSAAVAAIPGVKEFTVANAVNVIVEERPLFMEQVFLSVTWFLGINPDSFLDLVKLEFVEGDEQTARRLLKQGGHVIIAADFARTRHKGLQQVVDEKGNVVVGNTVRVWFNDRWIQFRVAGVIDSPALDIAAGYFQVESEAHVAATGSVIGTNADLKRLYNIDGSKLILLNFDLPAEAPPADWPPQARNVQRGGMLGEYYDESLPLERRWLHYRERQVLADLHRRLDAPQAFQGTARELKDEIDAELTRMTYLLTAVPAVALLVAAIGVANLMTANVASRTKQVAIMRAVGATRGLILRMVIGEALVLGLLGSGLGLALGMHLAWNTTTMTQRMWGFNVPFEIPWPLVGAAVALTVGLCIFAGIVPARHASRTNIIDALHVV